MIAWDGKTLAADRLIASDNLRCHSTTKIVRTPRGLFGWAGRASAAGDILAWFAAGAAPEKFPDSNRDGDNCTHLLHIANDGIINLYETGPYPILVHGTQMAIGAGADAAMATMYLGYDATKAVEVASAIVSGCGNGIDTLELAETKGQP